MKPGVRPVCLSGAVLAPEYPTYWAVSQADAAAVALLVQDGQVEYEPAYARGAMAPPTEVTVQPVVTRPAPPARAFQRKGR